MHCPPLLPHLQQVCSSPLPVSLLRNHLLLTPTPEQEFIQDYNELHCAASVSACVQQNPTYKTHSARGPTHNSAIEPKTNTKLAKSWLHMCTLLPTVAANAQANTHTKRRMTPARHSTHMICPFGSTRDSHAKMYRLQTHNTANRGPARVRL
jgi:hypothetical protein